MIDKKFDESRREGEFYFLYLGFKFCVFRCMKYNVRYGCKKFFDSAFYAPVIRF